MDEPKRGAKTGRSQLIQIRTSKRLKDRLSDAATENERSIAAEAEVRLTRSLEQDERVGSAQIAAMLDYIGAAARLVYAETDDELERSIAVRALFRSAADRLPKVQATPEIRQQLELASERVRAATESVLSAAKRPDWRKDQFGRPALPCMVDSLRSLSEIAAQPAGDIGLEGLLSQFAREADHGPTPMPHVNAPDHTDARRIEDGRVVGGAVDALKTFAGWEEFEPSPEEREWAEASDHLWMLLEQYSTKITEAENLANALLGAAAAYLSDPGELGGLPDDVKEKLRLALGER